MVGAGTITFSRVSHAPAGEGVRQIVFGVVLLGEWLGGDSAEFGFVEER